MRSYIEEIDDLLIGSTPREKYEYLLKLRSDNVSLYSKVEQAKTLVRGLLDTPGMKDIHSILSANYKTLTQE